MVLKNYPLNFERNGQLKRQEKRVQIKIDNDIVYYREAAKSSFKTLSYKFEIDYKLDHDTTEIEKKEYTPRPGKKPLVCLGHMVLANEAEKSELILGRDIFRRDFTSEWNFTILKGGYSLSETDWKTGAYYHMLEGGNFNNYQKFNEEFKKKFQLSPQLENPVDYLIIQGEDPVSQQPIYIELGKIPSPIKPTLRRSLDYTKYLLIKPFTSPKLTFFERYSKVETVRNAEEELKLYR